MFEGFSAPPDSEEYKGQLAAYTCEAVYEDLVAIFHEYLTEEQREELQKILEEGGGPDTAKEFIESFESMKLLV